MASASQSPVAQGPRDEEATAHLDAMNRIVTGFPTTKLSSLPQHLPNGRIIELSIRGDPAAVPVAMQQMKDEVHNLGFRFTVK